ncbi:hypothetical protein ABZ858_15720 [Streptomyces sp. NPDC047017]|uniref:hypothetical protein n=1 Tax=Streptomyces sp. NPDC047017 TaxID=3155024 RepID=UPI0033E64AFA
MHQRLDGVGGTTPGRGGGRSAGHRATDAHRAIAARRTTVEHRATAARHTATEHCGPGAQIALAPRAGIGSELPGGVVADPLRRSAQRDTVSGAG